MSLEEMGRNSVRPCTMPSTSASSQPIDTAPRLNRPTWACAHQSTVEGSHKTTWLHARPQL